MVADIAPVETVPSLLLSKNYEAVSDEEFRNSFPVIDQMGSHAIFAGRMRDEVWQSKLVQFMIEKDELDIIPWMEIIFLRIAADPSYRKPDPIRMFKEEFDKFGGWILPDAGKTNFNVYTWRKYIVNFVPSLSSFVD